jgi:hypothetical protein
MPVKIKRAATKVAVASFVWLSAPLSHYLACYAAWLFSPHPHHRRLPLRLISPLSFSLYGRFFIFPLFFSICRAI